jgi:1-acyl-sn-glycerol-3-phosphate acyltransferase
MTAVLIFNAIATMLVYRGAAYHQRLRQHWSGLVLRFVGGHIRTVGQEHVVPGANYVVAANHASLMDIPAMLGAMPLEFKFLAKRELLKVPFIGWYLRSDGHLTVDRHSLRSSIESTTECARLIRERHLSVLIFPEGTRSDDGQLQRFRDGAAFLAIQAGVPLLPVAIVGTDILLPARSSCFTTTNIEVRIGEPIPVEGLTPRNRAALTAQLEAAVRQLHDARLAV